MNISTEEARKLQEEGKAKLYMSMAEALKDKYFSRSRCEMIGLPVGENEETNVYALSRQLAAYSHGHESYVEVFKRKSVEIIKATSHRIEIKVGEKIYKLSQY